MRTWTASMVVLFASAVQADNFQSGFEGGVSASETLVAGNYASGIIVCKQNTELLMMTREAALKGVPLDTVIGMTPKDTSFQNALPKVHGGVVDVNAGGLAYLNLCLTELIEKMNGLTGSK